MNQTRKFKNFFNEYVAPLQKICLNHVKFTSGGLLHKRKVAVICAYLSSSGVDFATEVKLKCGKIPDILYPDHIKPIIEVMDSEDLRKFDEKKKMNYPVELRDEIIFVRADKEFNPKEIL